MAKRKAKLGDVVWQLPWIVRILLLFLDFVYGFARFFDGLVERKWLKAIVGFFWIFYGLGIGLIIDIIFVIINKRPPLL